VLDAITLVGHANRVANAFDPNLVDGDLAGIGRTLHVRHANGSVANLVHGSS
jgi:hypothetical protein